jgi:protein ImuB
MAIQKRRTKSQKRILCLWFPNWPIQRLIVEKPELKGQWLTLFKQDPRRGQLVAACSLRARQNGIKIGMPLSEAKSLAEKSVQQPPHSPQTTSATQLQHTNPPVFLPHDPEADLDILEQMADDCAIFSPIVGLEQVEQPSCIYLDITGLDKLFGSKTESGKYMHGEENIAEQISRHFSQRNYWPCISIASSIGLSWALRNTVLKLKTRTDSSVQQQTTGAKAPGYHAAIFPQTNDWMETQSHPDFVSLPVTCLRISNATISTLHQLGVSTIGQLIQLPRSGLVTRLGEELVQRLDQAAGRIEEVIIARHKPPEFQSELSLDHPTSHHETIDTIVWREIENICVHLKLKQEGALQVSCRLLCDSQFLRQAFDNEGKLVDKIEKKQFVCIRIGLFQPTVVPEHLMELIRMQLENLKLPGAVYEVKVSVPLSSRLVEKQKYLFDENPRDNPIALSQFVNRLSIRLGEENVLGFTSHSGAQPEFSFQYHRLASCLKRKRPLFESSNSTDKKAKRKNNRVAIKSPFRRNGELTNDASAGQTEYQKQGKYSYQPRPLDRPLRLLAAPLQLNVIAVSEGSPACFHWQDQKHVIVSSWGPERIQTGWWRGPMAERDYWRVETEAGNRFWLFRELRKNSWFLHGMF